VKHRLRLPDLDEPELDHLGRVRQDVFTQIVCLTDDDILVTNVKLFFSSLLTAVQIKVGCLSFGSSFRFVKYFAWSQHFDWDSAKCFTCLANDIKLIEKPSM
jgi:hypothetical protein